MNKLKTTLFIMTFICAISLNAQISNIEGIDFTDELTINDETFVLNHAFYSLYIHVLTFQLTFQLKI